MIQRSDGRGVPLRKPKKQSTTGPRHSQLRGAKPLMIQAKGFQIAVQVLLFLLIWNLLIPFQLQIAETRTEGLYFFHANSGRSASSVPGKSRDASQIINPEKCISVKATSGTKHPSGIVVTLLLGGSNPQLKDGVCNLFPSQLTHFIVPHELDVLLVVSGNLIVEEIARCLSLQVPDRPTGHERHNISIGRHNKPKKRSPASREWQNLDGSALHTWTYEVITVVGSNPFSTTVYLAHQPLQDLSSPSTNGNASSTAEQLLSFPHYIVENKSLLTQPIEPPMCQAPVEYIQGTRWYTNEMLHLGILSNYDYFIKLDPDVVFTKPVGFSVLKDMAIKGAVLGHAGEYPPGVPTPCAEGLSTAVAEYVASKTSGQICAVPDPVYNADRYYTNFLIGRVDVFQAKAVLDFAKWLSEYPQGFFRRRWTDQIFWHTALQLTTGLGSLNQLQDASSWIADYTDLRCFPVSNCWMTSLELKKYPDLDVCANGGIFVHTKHSNKWVHQWNRHLARRVPYSQEDSWKDVPPFHGTYHHDCQGTRWQ